VNNLTATDALVLVPLLPLAPLVLTWWLPWDRWIKFEDVPTRITGPYLLYCAFAAWYFRLPFWVIAVLLVSGIAFSVVAVHSALTRRS